MRDEWNNHGNDFCLQLAKYEEVDVKENKLRVGLRTLGN
jgi:hypothetical protein